MKNQEKIKRIIRYILIATVVVISLIAIIRLGTILSLIQIWDIVSAKIETQLHIPKAIAYAIAIPIAILLYKTILIVFTRNKKKRWIAIYILSAIMFTTFLIQHYLQKDWLFDSRNGTAIKSFSRNPLSGDLRLVASSYKYDPIYGNKVLPANENLVIEFAKQNGARVSENKKVVPSVKTEFFSRSGVPLLYYFKTSAGKFEFYSESGNHPIYNVPLKPVTPEIVQQVFCFYENEQDSMINGKTLRNRKTEYKTGTGLEKASNQLKLLIK